VYVKVFFCKKSSK